jgi:hypothetical protein
MSNKYVVFVCAIAAIASGTTSVEAGPDGLAVELFGDVNAQVTRIIAAPGDDTRLFICTKPGLIKILNWKTGLFNDNPFLDITDILTTATNEMGLCGLVFHPNYQDNGRFFVYGNVPEGEVLGDTVLFEGAREGDNPDLAEENLLRCLKIEKPGYYHNGGWMEFGSEGYLYMSIGDGGSPRLSDGPLFAQNITDGRLLGKVIRIDMNGDDFPKDPERNYAIPPDNPFVGTKGDDEIWAYGLRNPWSGSLDPLTGDIFLGDVGRSTMEELDVIVGGGSGGQNYGWRCMEGTVCTGWNHVCTCNDAALELPIWERSHKQDFWCAITGAQVYRGCAIPFIDGHVLVTDLCTNDVWTIEWNPKDGVFNEVDRTQEISDNSNAFWNLPTTVGHDDRGEIWIGCWAGEVLRLVPSEPVILDEDLDCNGTVEVSDLLALIADWGPCDGCRTDLNGDHDVSVEDLLLIINNWG